MKFRDGERLVLKANLLSSRTAFEHCPVADEEVHVILIEPKSTLNTGNITNEGRSPSSSVSESAIAPAAIQTSHEHRFYTLDVFTNNRFEGNRSRITDGDGLSTINARHCARMNLSETVFVQKPRPRSARAMRIFTTKEELSSPGIP